MICHIYDFIWGSTKLIYLLLVLLHLLSGTPTTFTRFWSSFEIQYIEEKWGGSMILLFIDIQRNVMVSSDRTNELYFLNILDFLEEF